MMCSYIISLLKKPGSIDPKFPMKTSQIISMF